MPNAFGVPTAKDFQRIASAVADARRALPEFPEYLHGHKRQIQVMDSMAREIADVLQRTNPKFDRVRFLSACGVK